MIISILPVWDYLGQGQVYFPGDNKEQSAGMIW